MSALERAAALGSFLATEISAYLETGDPTQNRLVECLSTVLQSVPHINRGDKYVFEDCDLEGFIDVLQEIKLSLADEESHSTLGALKAHIGTTLMRIPSCADEGKKLRDARWSDRTNTKDVEVNAQGLCDEVCPSSRTA